MNGFPPVPVGGQQRDGGRLQPSHPHLKLHQRAGLGIPPAQPEERPAAQALRRPQVRREEDRGGGLRPVHPRAGQGGGAWVGKVVPESHFDWLWETEQVARSPHPGCCAWPCLRGKPPPPQRVPPEGGAAVDVLCECLSVCNGECGKALAVCPD